MSFLSEGMFHIGDGAIIAVGHLGDGFDNVCVCFVSTGLLNEACLIDREFRSL
jgi:hypothetical protein